MRTVSIQVGNRVVDIFDSGYINPVTYLKPVSAEVVEALTIPSSRYYYLSKDGSKIPYLALSTQDQTKRDVKAWQNQQRPVKSVYTLGVEEFSDPELDLLKIIQGIGISGEVSNRYMRSFQELLNTYSQLDDPLDRFVIPVNNGLITSFLTNPFNPAANFIRASQLAESKDPVRIQAYLDEIGIIHFKAEDIYNLTIGYIFFYLTRFYGVPRSGDLDAKATVVRYLKQAVNKEARKISNLISENLEIYRKHQAAFDAYFIEINRDPNQEIIWTGLGATDKHRFYRSFFQYLSLLDRPKNLPKLTLNSVRQLRAGSVQQLVDFLKMYLDQDILNLIKVDQGETRTAFLRLTAENLLKSRVFIMHAYEAQLCRNAETAILFDEFAELNYPYLGKGNLANGFDCYTIAELFQTFESNRDDRGAIRFRDPLNYNSEFRLSDLRQFRDALAEGRDDVDVPPDFVQQFDVYIREAELQQSDDYQQILQLRRFSDRELMRNFWMTYFNMGMYMRQWRGPGNPYPTRAEETGTEAVPGTATEVEIAENVSDSKIRLGQLLNQMPQQIQESIRGLTVVKRINDQVENTNYHLGQLYTLVINGRFCIRMASGPWAYTGAYYLKQILNEDIPGFDLGSNVEHIQ